MNPTNSTLIQNALSSQTKNLSTSKSQEVLLVEFVTSQGLEPLVDPQQGIIRRVKVLGTQSRNGRVYPLETIRDAVQLYERARVHVDHPSGHPALPRRYQDRLGYLDNVQVEEQGLFADLHFNPHHPVAPQLVWDAQHAPENVGLSHNIRARIRPHESQCIVEKILEVYSVDLVADPATTQGLFECTQQGISNSDEAWNLYSFYRRESSAWLQRVLEQTLRRHGLSWDHLPPRTQRILLSQPPGEAVALLQEWLALWHQTSAVSRVQSAGPLPQQNHFDITHWARSLT